MARSARPIPGQVVLITGAARGIGAESARRLAAKGASVSLVGLEPEQLERTAASCGRDALWFEADVRDVDALQGAVEGTVERFGGIDVVVANAGVAPAGTVRAIDPAAFERAIEINLLGVWRTVRACLPHVIERRGYVLVVSSLAAAAHMPGMAPYAASKAGVEAFADCLRLEVEHKGVDVGVAYFSWIATDMVAGADAHPAFGFARAKLRGPAGKTYPVGAVADALVRGVALRRRWITVPRWLPAILILRGALRPLYDAAMRRSAAEMDERFEREVIERGRAEASAPVGAGGAAVHGELVNRAS